MERFYHFFKQMGITHENPEQEDIGLSRDNLAEDTAGTSALDRQSQ